MRDQKKKVFPLTRDVLEARRLGLTYGHYKARFYRPVAQTLNPRRKKAPVLIM